jgi:hypothetical protein
VVGDHLLRACHNPVRERKAAAVDQLREVTRVQPADEVAAALVKSLTNGAADGGAVIATDRRWNLRGYPGRFPGVFLG